MQMIDNNYLLITGATGFLGSHILKFFFNNTNYNFLILKRKNSDITRIKDLLSNPRIQYFDLDTKDNFQNLQEIFKSKKITAIIHCATNYGRDKASCANVLEANLIFPIKLLELAVQNQVEVFINTDSYFNKSNMSYLYLQNYSLSKKSLNLWLEYFSKNIKIVNVILEHIYGEYDSLEKFIPYAVNEIAIKKSEEINLTYGDQKRDFIYIEDVVRAYKYLLDFALNNQLKLKNFDLGAGCAISIKDFTTIIKSLSNSPTILNFGSIPYREDEIMCSIADNSELLNLGWKPNYSIEEGIRRYIKIESEKLQSI